MNTINGNFLERTIPSLKGALVTLNMGNSTSEMNLEDLATNLGAGVTSIIPGSGISVDQSTGNVTISATGGGGGGTNPTSTYVPYNNEGTFADSCLINDAGNSVLKTGFGAETGLKLDYAYKAYILGDYDNNVNGTSLWVQDTDKCIKTVGDYGWKGLLLDFNTQVYTLGDYEGLTTNTKFVVDVINQIIKTMDGGTDKGVFLDFANNIYGFGNSTYETSLSFTNNEFNLSNRLKIDFTDGNVLYIGDIDSSYTKTAFAVDPVNSIIQTFDSNNKTGLKLDFANKLYSLGELNGGNNTRLEIDGNNQFIRTFNDNTGVRGFDLNFANDEYYFGASSGTGIGGVYVNGVNRTVKIGDSTGNGDNTFLQIDDNNQKLILSANLETASAGSGAAGKRLKITIGGNDYLIDLITP